MRNRSQKSCFQQGAVNLIFVAIVLSLSGLGSWYYLDSSASIRQLDLEVVELEDQLLIQKDAANSEIEDLTSQLLLIPQQNAKLASSEIENRELIQEIEASNTINSKLERELLAAQAEIDKANERLTQLNLKENTLLAELNSQNEAIKTFQVKLVTAQSVEEQYKSAREQLALQQTKNEDYSSTIETLELKLKNEAEAMNSLEQSLQSQLSELNEEKQSLITQLVDGTTVIKLPESILFPSGSADIGEQGEHALNALATALLSFPDHLVSVQGHSDSRTISSSLKDRYPTNWELSSARASSAVRILVANNIDPNRLQALGFAHYKPLVDEIDAQTRQQNRRIEVLLYPGSMQTKSIEPAN